MTNLREKLKDVANHAWNGTSFDPEKRAERFLSDHEQELTADLERIPETERESYSTKYIALLRAYLYSHSNLYSTMIAGASNFPAARMNKRANWTHNKYQTFSDWRERALKAIEKKAKQAAFEASGLTELDVYRNKLEAEKKHHAMLIESNKIVKHSFKNKLPIDQIKELLRTAGMSEDDIRVFLTVDESGNLRYYTWMGLPNSLARIKNLEQRIKVLETRETSTAIEFEGKDGIKIVQNIPINRVQIFFEGKPDESTRTNLKRNGFRWTPSQTCWQAYINNSSINFIQTNYAPLKKVA